jgi:hypothetical protein
MRLKILGHIYEIIFNKNQTLEHNTVGSCCSNTQEIKIGSNYPITNQEEVLLHEILEAIKYRLDLSDTDFSHRTLSSISETLYCVIRDNPLIFSLRLPKNED